MGAFKRSLIGSDQESNSGSSERSALLVEKQGPEKKPLNPDPCCIAYCSICYISFFIIFRILSTSTTNPIRIAITALTIRVTHDIAIFSISMLIILFFILIGEAVTSYSVTVRISRITISSAG